LKCRHLSRSNCQSTRSSSSSHSTDSTDAGTEVAISQATPLSRRQCVTRSQTHATCLPNRFCVLVTKVTMPIITPPENRLTCALARQIGSSDNNEAPLILFSFLLLKVPERMLKYIRRKSKLNKCMSFKK
jgi:hypothetical protein